MTEFEKLREQVIGHVMAGMSIHHTDMQIIEINALYLCNNFQKAIEKKTREDIRAHSELIQIGESMSGQEGDWASLDENCGEIDDMTANVDLYITPTSILAPFPEGEKI